RDPSAACTPVAVVFFSSLVIVRQYICTWTHEPRPDVAWWLTSKWFFLRNGLILVLLSWLSWRFVRHDTAPDARELESGEVVARLTDSGVITRDAAILVLAY